MSSSRRRGSYSSGLDSRFKIPFFKGMTNGWIFNPMKGKNEQRVNSMINPINFAQIH